MDDDFASNSPPPYTPRPRGPSSPPPYTPSLNTPRPRGPRGPSIKTPYPRYDIDQSSANNSPRPRSTSTSNFPVQPLDLSNFTEDEKRQQFQSTFPMPSLKLYNDESSTISRVRPPRSVKRQPIDPQNLIDIENNLKDEIELITECLQNHDVCSLIKQQQNILAKYMEYCTLDSLVNVRSIGKPSNNGFNLLLTYNREFILDVGNINVESSCVLKSSKSKNADNLLYEYFVGRYLNKRINENFPFFVTTHALYKYKSTNHYQYVKDNFNNIDIDLLKQSIKLCQCKVIRNELNENDRKEQWRRWLRSSFDEPLRTCILIETVPHAKGLWHYLTNNDDSFYAYSLIPVLFQVYGALHKLRDVFTHYDLHTDNVLLTILPGHYFSYTVHYNGIQYKFDSFFLVKIIDYGRSYCEKSERIIQELCETVPNLNRKRLCNQMEEDETDLRGYAYAVRNPLDVEYPPQTVSVINNKSSDLHCLNIIFNQLPDREMYRLENYTNGLEQYINKLIFRGAFSTPETQNTFFREGDNISTVSDAFHMLCSLVQRNGRNYNFSQKRNREAINLEIDFNDIGSFNEEYWNWN